MLQSMTGFGDARIQEGSLNVAVEIRSVNNRYFKLTLKSPEAFARFEADIESLLRKTINRGTVQVSISIQQLKEEARFQFDETAFSSYWNQYQELSSNLGAENTTPDPTTFFSLPGVVREKVQEPNNDEQWPTIKAALKEAVEKLNGFRAREGEAIQADLQENCQVVAQELKTVTERAPLVVEEYREKMLSRINEFLTERGAVLEPSDIIREVGIFTDRCDISEEIQRLSTHIEQFETFLNQSESMGRKLEFLGQEMFREINTIGSKANDVTIAHAVVEMKASIERIRENLQNVE